jgi:moderate conductance mechanosensitive channel
MQISFRVQSEGWKDSANVRDQIETMEVSGVVESVGLRITTVRSLDGTLWYLRNGEILKIGNKSQPKAN